MLPKVNGHDGVFLGEAREYYTKRCFFSLVAPLRATCCRLHEINIALCRNKKTEPASGVVLRQLGHLQIRDPQLSAPPSRRVWLFRESPHFARCRTKSHESLSAAHCPFLDASEKRGSTGSIAKPDETGDEIQLDVVFSWKKERKKDKLVTRIFLLHSIFLSLALDLLRCQAQDAKSCNLLSYKRNTFPDRSRFPATID